MTVTDEASLLRAVLDHPAEDTPRLMYADWLQEHGQEARAEFIRVQCEIERVPSFRAPECDPLRIREKQLMARGEERDWFMPNVFAHRIEWEFRRGFVAELTCASADWLAHADAITAAHPVERVRFTGPLTPAAEVWFDNEDQEWPVGEKIAGKTFSYSRIDRFIADNLAHKPAGYRTLAVLMLRWPGVTFELPPAVSGPMYSGGTYRIPVAPGASLEAGDLVFIDGDGRAVPAPHSAADGVVVSVAGTHVNVIAIPAHPATA